MTEKQNNLLDDTLAKYAGKYLTFHLSQEIYGIQILKVHEIIGLMDVTRVPNTPEFVKGVINLRGKVIPVIDLRCKFNMNATQVSERNCIIILQITGEQKEVIMGIVVDEVAEVTDVMEKQIESTPSFDTTVNTNYILAIGKVKEKVIMLLDVDQFLSGGEIELLDKATGGGLEQQNILSEESGRLNGGKSTETSSIS